MWKATTLVVGRALLAIAVVSGSARAEVRQPCPSDIALMDLSPGSTPVVVTHTPTACEYNPSLSNDGKYVVYDRFYIDENQNQIAEGIWRTEISSGASSRIVDRDHPGDDSLTPEDDAVYSPNGQLLLYQRYDHSGVYLIAPDGTGARRLLAPGNFGAKWAPSSRALVHHSYNPADETVTIRVTGIAGGDSVLVSSFGYGPAWSPNGRWIGFATTDWIPDDTLPDGGRLVGRIWRVPVSQAGEPLGTAEIALEVSGWVGGWSWLGNSHGFVYSSNDALWMAEGGTITKIQPEVAYDPMVSNDGRKLVFALQY